MLCDCMCIIITMSVNLIDTCTSLHVLLYVSALSALSEE